METIEQLRREMIFAFHEFAKKKPERRQDEWDAYCRARENFLRESALLNKSTYQPLKATLVH